MPLNSALWVVATPLGNLGDISSRALDVLRSAGLILAEDTRKTGLLLEHLGITGKKFLSLHEHNEEKRVMQAMAEVESGVDCCLVSDAGTPLIADPGYRLVRAFRSRGINVIPIPGPCAPITALMASGLPPYPFAFLGFTPRKQGDIASLFSKWITISATLIFFERKNRLNSTLDTAYKIFGSREFCVARELTKRFEEFIHGQLGTTVIDENSLLGEITVIVAPPGKEEMKTPLQQIQNMIDECTRKGMKAKETARAVHLGAHGWSTKAVYELMIRGEN
ncbi:16S rRNA (cytidine(1402)-2'-O)-methyltransferase [Desulfonatronovibrio magnus]|uniref:16S rRNA (cytidine(1402)-2'-O)-methyltransferase n=1 Tax=Desulfonatronovibrio magnus TaxID=698827 RepID=UPI0005EBC225|nr:16S rRNA (cytidine(1402)-2'-O)-methyltransferase [Desulfonatronovibrio magnus]